VPSSLEEHVAIGSMTPPPAVAGTDDADRDASMPGSGVRLEGLVKRYGEVEAVSGIDLDIADGEFFSMLGPSGSGKTTTLRMIAGFELPTEGRVLLHGRDVTDVPPFDRDVNTVFQDYALFPHMTVGQNVAYGLIVRKVPAREREERVGEALRMVRLAGYEGRRPAQLSGGQRQRVALARALVNRPRVLLLDEPLGALDLKLRKEMQLELKDLQQRTGTTFVYVTHDQEEAMTMSDRIAVMNGGVVEQLATPRELYQRPASAFVAGFIGTSNLIELRVDRRDDGLLVMDVGEGERILAVQPDAGAGAADRVTITVRPEWIKLVSGDAGPRASHVGGTVIDVVYLGSVTQLIVLLRTGEKLTVHRLNDEVGSTDPRPGEHVTLHWAAEHSYVVGSSPETATTANDTEATARAGA